MPFKKYIEKRAVVQAVQWTPGVKLRGIKITKDDFGYHLFVSGGWIVIEPKWWIVKEGTKISTICGSDFEETYNIL